MRHRARLASVLFLAVAAMGAEAVGCVSRYDPAEGCEGPACTAGGGAGGQPDPTKNCDLTDKSLPPDGSCGVFVRSSAAGGGDGSKERPFQSFTEAAAKSPKRVYACGETGETYAETTGVIFADGVKIYGGFEACDGAWTWSTEARATLQGPADAVALTLNGGNSRLENVDVVAANASAADADAPGRSSIALLANGGTVALVNGRIEAGNATNGAQAGAIARDPMLDGIGGDPGLAVCSPGATHDGPAGPVTRCADGQSEGGKGGDGGTVMGTVASPVLSDAGDGTSGKPAPSGSAPKGAGGTRETADQICTNGEDGSPGEPGEPAGPSEGLGTIDANGYTGALALRGGTGRPGQGGGGGGGARGTAAACEGSPTKLLLPGASGGAGGSGGCGGQGGHAGHPGGSSIALVVIDATISLDGVSLVSGNAGDGGPGGDGQLGGNGSSGGDPGARAGDAEDSCAGGRGGRGGKGGPGGGGHGGHSLGVAFRGGELRGISNASFTLGQEGTGAPGVGTAPNNGAKGADGLAAQCWNFAENEDCSTTSEP
ncbi:hypothetical protein [Sorangium sp. So ce363]|uniref:hypothetical protein n=1 Tax=Sorangium sp. So ce363 TaxID=3133304 RepID=UPI003F5EFC79